MRVMVQLRKDAAMELQGGGARAASASQTETQKLLAATDELGVTLEPVHPGQTHPLLAPFFMVEVPDPEQAEKVINGLQQFDIVEAAYLKPEEQLP